MRQVPSRYVMPKAATLKKQVAQIAHVQPPLKGLSLSSKSTPGDPLTAPILVNFTVEDDRIQSRVGYRKLSAIGTEAVPSGPIWHLIPHYSQPSRLLSAANNKLYNAFTAAEVKAGFTSNDWHWTSFSNLSDRDYTILVNGADGVWSWDGGLTSTDPGLVTVTSLSSSNPAICTVAPADIGLFQNGMVVTVSGATGVGAPANGAHSITAVGSPANSFTLVGVNTSGGSAQTVGVKVDPPSTGVVKEIVTAPAGNTWIVPAQFQVVLSHMNRLWFADSTNLAVYYLPTQTKSGEVKHLPLNAVFRRGGAIRAMYTWTMDGGAGMDDNLVIFSTNGECVIYSGTDPDGTDFSLVGIFRFDSPMSKHSVVNYGGDLYVLISTGLVPMSTLIRAETEQLGQADKTVVSLFRSEAIKYRDRQGWQAFLNPSSGRLFCNIPQGYKNNYIQMVRHMPNPVWAQYQDVPARCWNWIDPYVYFGDDDGNVYEMHPNHLNDDGKPIRVDVQMAWHQYKTPARKQFKMVQVHLITDGEPMPFIDIKCDYDYSMPVNQPDVSLTVPGAVWDVAEWDTAEWATGPRPVRLWNGVGNHVLGYVAGPRMTAYVKDCSFAVTGWDIIYEQGAAI